MKFKIFAIGLTCLLLAGSFVLTTGAAKKLPWLHTQGEDIVNDQGDRVQLRGVNLGSWLLMELWMDLLDQQPEADILTAKDLWDLFARRFGKERAQELLRLYRKTFITEEDIRYLSGIGINLVRVPIWWRVLSSEFYAGEGTGYLDQLLSWCEKYQVYCILDLHSAPGGQNDDVAILGERSKNGFWSNPVDQRETVAIWEGLAARYANRSVVMGYDLLNEAWGAPDMPKLIAVYDELYRAVRKIDPRHILILEDALQGLHRMPRPADQHWKNVVYSVHIYPHSMQDTEDWINIRLANLRRAQNYLDVPLNIGEFNTIQLDRGGVDYLQKFIKIFNRYDWSWNLWSYKKIENNQDINWGLVGMDPQRHRVDLKSLSFEEVRKLFASYQTRQLHVNLMLEAALKNSRQVKPMPEPKLEGQQPLQLTAEMATISRAEGGTLRIEWQYTPPNLGFWGLGDAALWTVTVPRDGVYSVSLNYASQAHLSGMEFWVDDLRYASFREERTGDWSYYVEWPLGRLQLAAGEHRLRLVATQDHGDGFINLRWLALQAAPGTPPGKLLQPDQPYVRLTPFNLERLERNGDIGVEWQNNPPNLGHWARNDAAYWQVRILGGGRYRVRLRYSTPYRQTRLMFSLNGQLLFNRQLGTTGEWHHYDTLDLGEVLLENGPNRFSMEFETEGDHDAGNFRYVELDKI